MEMTKMNDVPKKVFNKRNGPNTLLGIAGWVSLIFGVILFSLGLWTQFHEGGGPLTASYRDDTVYVEAMYGKEARIPKEAELRARLITPEEDPDAYSQNMTSVMAAVGRDGEEVPANAIYNVGFYVGDQEVEPAAPVNVTVQVLQDGFAAGEPIKVVHLGENDAEVIADTAVDDAGFISFTTDGFSSFAFTLQPEEEAGDGNTIKTAEGKSTAVKPSYYVFVNQSLGDRVSVGNWNEIKTAAEENKDSIYQLTDNITADSSCTVMGKLTIDLGGHTIKAGDELKGSLFSVEGGTLTLRDSAQTKESSEQTEESAARAGGLGFIVQAEESDTQEGGSSAQTEGSSDAGTINNSGHGAPIITVKNGKFIMQGGKLTGTKNADKGGAVYVNGSGEAEISGGEISGNAVKSDGGGVYVEGNGKITITGSAVITDNTAAQGGGAYARDEGSKLIVEGGTITKNTATKPDRGGGGVYGYQAGNITVSGGEISYNTASSGGGIFVADNGGELVIINALIADNSAGGFGGGLGACSTGHVFFGNGEDGTPIAAIFGNSASGQNLSGSSSAKRADWDAYRNEVFMSSGYQDMYSALEAVISGTMLGFGDEAWSGSADGAPMTVNKGGFVSASQMLGLTSHASDADQANARSEASVFITGNSSSGSSKEDVRESRKSRVIAVILLGCCVLTSIYLIVHTPASDWFHSMRMEKIIADYDETVAALSVEERTGLREAALAYNSRLRLGTHFRLNQDELEEYGAQLDFIGTGVMGYVRIPKIKVLLPIYHTASEEVLEKAVGHIPGSSLPVGGESCHTVLCGHRDQSDAYLFHDLDKLEAGDTFTLAVLDETITYKVDQIRIVFPRQVDDLAIEAGKDYCTLVTCHPHGSSTYRMLVRGKRV